MPELTISEVGRICSVMVSLPATLRQVHLDSDARRMRLIAGILETLALELRSAARWIENERSIGR